MKELTVKAVFLRSQVQTLLGMMKTKLITQSLPFFDKA
jgi:hypothetical protein